MVDYQYAFKFEDKESLFDIKLDPETLLISTKPPADPPLWTQLDHSQCSHCPLNKQDTPHCPIAVNLVPIIEAFENHFSHENVEVMVSSDERTYEAKVSLEAGLSSLLGIYMVSSGCPKMEKLKPMVRFHLPFASPFETIYRVVSMYLMSQFLLKRQGGTPDWELKDLVAVYEDVQKVNEGFSQRLLSAITKDASSNALMNLNFFADEALFQIKEAELEELEKLFQAYL